LKDLLRARGIEFESIDVIADDHSYEEMLKRTGGKQYVPQLFIGDQYIGGFSDYLLKDAQGEIDRLLGREVEVKARQAVYDVIIIGGGPAGLTAAVYAARKNLDVLLISEQLGGQPLMTSNIENYMGYQYITGPELMAKFEEQARNFDIDIEAGQVVTSLAVDGALMQAVTASGRVFLGQTLIIATGKKSRPLDIPGEKEFVGRGLSYCATCDGALFKGEPVMVAGGGNSGIQAALELAGYCPDVYLVSLSDLMADEVLVGKVAAAANVHQYVHWRPVEIKGDSKMQSVVIAAEDGSRREEVSVSALFVEVGLQPNSGFTTDLLDLNQRGEIVVDKDCRTGIRGVFAAGDVTQVRAKQIVVAAGEGAKAALSAHEYLLTRR
jgi:alkyl hydroperoxide reductase subunit F